MIKRLLVSFLFLLICVAANAQDYKVVSVDALPMDMSARKHIKTDDNDKQCALFRIATQNIAPENKEGFHFDSDYGSQVVEHSIIDGEIWVWVSPGIKTLKISHKEWGKYELHLTKYLPKVESLFTYKIVIEGLIEPSQSGALTISSTPQGAELFLNDEYVGVTPYTATLPFGKYEYVIKKDYHKDIKGEVTLDNELKGVNEVLNPICGGLEIRTTPDDASVQIDGVNCGTTPVVLKSILIGPHNITIYKKGFEMEMLTLNVEEDQTLRQEIELTARQLEEVLEEEMEIYADEQIGTSQLLTNKMIRTVPSMARQMNDVLALIPQSVTTSSGLAAGGGNYRQSNFTVDGAVFNNVFGIGSNLPGGGSGLSLEQVRSLTFDIAPHDVRENDFIGASINAITKSGTNDLHVNVYDYFQSDGLQGIKYGNKDEYGDYPDPLKLSETYDNTLGASIGGPIVKDKLFYYLNFEYIIDIDPGQTRFARRSDDDEWGYDSHFNRPTANRMEEIRNFLQSHYNYDPGRYENYKASTPDYKLLARLDWNIGQNNSLTLRYTRMSNKYSSSPSSSINPFPSSLYNRNIYGRTSDCALYFESCRYYQGQSFSSIVGQLNSKSKNGNLNNTFRISYSNQDEPRSTSSGDFPTVDILESIDTDGNGSPETRAVYTSFGPDPFSSGNLRAAKVLMVTEELGLKVGKHDFLGGIQFEHNHYENAFRQGGNGYYVYESWHDFANNGKPLAFCYTYGNNESRMYETPWLNLEIFSAYLQDEIRFGQRFKMSLGIRAELPYYPSITDRNYNKEFAEGWTDEEGIHHAIADGNNSMSGLSTADVPSPSLLILPRFAFSVGLDAKNNFVIRGSSGLYSGRIPGVWLISALGNSNCAAQQYINFSNPEIRFYTSESELINNNLDLFTIGENPAPQSTTILDKNLKMPEVWKTSLVFDAKLPKDFLLMFNFVYGKEINSLAVTKLGIIQDDFIQLPGEPDSRAKWSSEGVVNSLGKAITPYYLTNASNKGYHTFITLQLAKQVGSKLNLLAAYTYGVGKNANDGIGEQITSAYNTNTYGVHGSNAQELGYASYISPNRLLFYAGYTFREGRHHSNTFGIYYEGRNLAYIGGYSYCRYSYTMTSNVNGDGGANSLLYIPTQSELNSMPFTEDENRDAFNRFIENDKYLSAHRGQYAERGGVIAPFFHTINLHYTHDFILKPNSHKIQIGLDMKNIANLINRKWGNMRRLSSGDILKISGNGTEGNPYTYQFMEPTWAVYASSMSTWAMSLSIRYSF